MFDSPILPNIVGTVRQDAILLENKLVNCDFLLSVSWVRVESSINRFKLLAIQFMTKTQYSADRQAAGQEHNLNLFFFNNSLPGGVWLFAVFGLLRRTGLNNCDRNKNAK